ncbi:MAG: 2-dehydropantoate 2-reductase, partial [Chitinophagaceae bacterium]|nr:2-dehydropantoate 2-reductase [Polaromonas sp.]
MKVCIYGAGAIGLWMGHGLALAGCHVSVVARGATLAALQARGVQLVQGEYITTQAVLASNQPGDFGVQDLVVLSVKAPSLPEVAAHIAPLLGPNTLVLTAMNGVPWWFLQGFGGPLAGQQLRSVDAEGRIAQAIAAPHIVGCVVHASCSTPQPGTVQHHFGNQLIVGEPSGRRTERVQTLADWLEKAGFKATVSPHIQHDIWFKLWGNMTMNPISALTGATTDVILADPLVRGFISSVMLEAKAIGGRLGIQIDQQPEDRHAVTHKLGAFKTSMLQDVEARKPIELDALVGAVRELGQLTGVATPCTDAL